MGFFCIILNCPVVFFFFSSAPVFQLKQYSTTSVWEICATGDKIKSFRPRVDDFFTQITALQD